MMKAVLMVEGCNPVEVALVACAKQRFRVEANLLQWHVVDGAVEPEGATGVGAGDAHSLASWQRNALGDEMCKRKAETLCRLLNELHAKAGFPPSA